MGEQESLRPWLHGLLGSMVPGMNKWIWVIVLAVVGIIAAVFAIEYLTTSIGHLPSWMPASNPGKRGHAYKRGYFAAFIAVLCFGGAGYFAYTITRSNASSDASGDAAQ